MLQVSRASSASSLMRPSRSTMIQAAGPRSPMPTQPPYKQRYRPTCQGTPTAPWCKTSLNFVLNTSTEDLIPTYGIVISAASGGQDIDDDGNEITINSVTIHGAATVFGSHALTSAHAQGIPSNALALVHSVMRQVSRPSSASSLMRPLRLTMIQAAGPRSQMPIRPPYLQRYRPT